MCFKNHIALVISIISGILFAHAQTKCVIHGRITNKEGKSIPYAAIQNMNTGNGINATALGDYVFKTSLPASLEVFALGYNIEKKQISNSDKDSVEINFELSPNAAELQPITIGAGNPAHLLLEAPNLQDFELKDSKLWLVYRLKGGDKIEVTDTGGRSITQLIRGYYFYRDSINQTPHGFLYTIYKDSLQLYSLDNDNIKVNSMLLETYKKYSGNLVGFRHPYYYYVSFDSDMRVNYSYLDKTKNVTKKFFSFRDSKLARANKEIDMTMFVLEVLLIIRDADTVLGGSKGRRDSLISIFGYEPGIQKIKSVLMNVYLPKGVSMSEINSTLAQTRAIVQNQNAQDPYVLKDWLQELSRWRSEIFSLMRIINDSVYIFNFDNNIISIYSPNNEYVRQVPLGLSVRTLNKFWGKDIIVDDITHECYFKYKNWLSHTYLEKINLATGNISYKIELKYAFIDKIRISGGYAYFSFVGSASDDNNVSSKTCLYKQKLD